MSNAVEVGVGDDTRHDDQSFPQPDAERVGGAATRDRKMRAVSAAELEAARKLIQPIAPPQRIPARKRNHRFGTAAAVERDNDRIVFPPDPTPPDPMPADPTPPASARTSRRPAPPVTAAAPAPAGQAAPQPPPKFPPPELSEDEMAQVIALVQHKYGPILSLDQAAELSKLAKQTLRERVCDGMYATSVVRGRPLRFWTHRFVQEVMK